MANKEFEANAAFHEIWWIFSDQKEPWAGLRIAHYRKTVNGEDIVFIAGETADRLGPRTTDAMEREGWVKVKRIILPTPSEVMEAINKESRSKNDSSVSKG